MDKFSKSLMLFLIGMTMFFGGCISGEYDGKDYEEFTDSTYVENNTPVNEQYNTTAQANDNLYRLNVSSSLEFAAVQQFSYYEEAGKLQDKINFSFVFNQESLLIEMEESEFTWTQQYTFSSPWRVKLSLVGRTYSTTVNPGNKNLEIFIAKNDKLEHIKLGNRVFLKVAPSQNSSNTSLKYMDNHEVVVRPGDNLKGLIATYNRENPNSPTTLDKVLKLNPSVKNRKNVIQPGEIVLMQ